MTWLFFLAGLLVGLSSRSRVVGAGVVIAAVLWLLAGGRAHA